MSLLLNRNIHRSTDKLNNVCQCKCVCNVQKPIIKKRVLNTPSPISPENMEKLQKLMTKRSPKQIRKRGKDGRFIKRADSIVKKTSVRSKSSGLKKSPNPKKKSLGSKMTTSPKKSSRPKKSPSYKLSKVSKQSRYYRRRGKDGRFIKTPK